MKLSECRILLTGATGGIGQALCEQLCEAGATVLAVGRNTAPLAALKQRFDARLLPLTADLTDATERARVLRAAREMGGLNSVINAAGVNQFVLLEHQDEEQIAELVGVNVTATLQLTHALLPLLQVAPRALLINLGSTFGSIGYPGFSAYCTSKFALRGFSEALRRELADTRVKVLYVAPRATRTAMNSDQVVAMNQALRVGMDDPGQVAERILRAIEQEREELYLGWPERFFVGLNSLLPRLVDHSLRKQLPTILRFARHH